jgi:predicted Zn finger-like uncharacterized protein
MGMDKTLFEKQLEPLGRFKKKYGDGADNVFVPHPTSNLCPLCLEGHYLVIEKKWGWNDRPYWRVKCRTCKETWKK